MHKQKHTHIYLYSAQVSSHNRSSSPPSAGWRRSTSVAMVRCRSLPASQSPSSVGRGPAEGGQAPGGVGSRRLDFRKRRMGAVRARRSHRMLVLRPWSRRALDGRQGRGHYKWSGACEWTAGGEGVCESGSGRIEKKGRRKEGRFQNMSSVSWNSS